MATLSTLVKLYGHGNLATYIKGSCRCDSCLNAWARYGSNIFMSKGK